MAPAQALTTLSDWRARPVDQAVIHLTTMMRRPESRRPSTFVRLLVLLVAIALTLTACDRSPSSAEEETFDSVTADVLGAVERSGGRVDNARRWISNASRFNFYAQDMALEYRADIAFADPVASLHAFAAELDLDVGPQPGGAASGRVDGVYVRLLVVPEDGTGFVTLFLPAG